MSNIDVNIGNVRRLQELVDKNSKNIPEGDYLALCDITKKIYEREEEMTIITWMVCLRQAEQAMQCCASRPGFDPANNPKHEARWRKYEKRRRKYARRLDDAGYDVPVYVEYDMEAKQLQVAYPATPKPPMTPMTPMTMTPMTTKRCLPTTPSLTMTPMTTKRCLPTTPSPVASSKTGRWSTRWT